jgi:hypothetical protein
LPTLFLSHVHLRLIFVHSLRLNGFPLRISYIQDSTHRIFKITRRPILCNEGFEQPLMMLIYEIRGSNRKVSHFSLQRRRYLYPILLLGCKLLQSSNYFIERFTPSPWSTGTAGISWVLFGILCDRGKLCVIRLQFSF